MSHKSLYRNRISEKKLTAQYKKLLTRIELPDGNAVDVYSPKNPILAPIGEFSTKDVIMKDSDGYLWFGKELRTFGDIPVVEVWSRANDFIVHVLEQYSNNEFLQSIDFLMNQHNSGYLAITPDHLTQMNNQIDLFFNTLEAYTSQELSYRGKAHSFAHILVHGNEFTQFPATRFDAVCTSEAIHTKINQIEDTSGMTEMDAVVVPQVPWTSELICPGFKENAICILYDSVLSQADKEALYMNHDYWRPCADLNQFWIEYDISAFSGVCIWTPHLTTQIAYMFANHKIQLTTVFFALLGLLWFFRKYLLRIWKKTKTYIVDDSMFEEETRRRGRPKKD